MEPLFELATHSGTVYPNETVFPWTVLIVVYPYITQELVYLQAGLSRVVGADGTVVRGMLSGSRNVAGPPQNHEDTETSSRRLLLGVTHPLVRSRAQSLWASFNFDALQSKEDQFKQDAFQDEVRALRPSLYYYVADGWGGENGVNLEGSLGLTTLGASSSGPERSRTDADTSFRKARLDAWRNQALFGPWSLYGQFAGQVSDRPLLSSEEFALGGARFGRAYDPAIVSGDRGAAGSVELRFTEPLRATLSEYQLYGLALPERKWLQAGLTKKKPSGHKLFPKGFRSPDKLRPDLSSRFSTSSLQEPQRGESCYQLITTRGR